MNQESTNSVGLFTGKVRPKAKPKHVWLIQRYDTFQGCYVNRVYRTRKEAIEARWAGPISGWDAPIKLKFGEPF